MKTSRGKPLTVVLDTGNEQQGIRGTVGGKRIGWGLECYIQIPAL